MQRIVFVNGRYLPDAEASVSIFDRGFLFADGIYEVSSVLRGRLIDNRAHLARLRRSMGELDLPSPATDEEIVAIQKTLIERNNVEEGVVYLQITRGAAERDFGYPADPTPTLVMFTQHKQLIDSPVAARGISIITLPEIRWRRRDIKSVGLLPACMAKQAALDAGAQDAWLVEDGLVTEGSSNNAYILTHAGEIRTRPLGREILHGITRAAILRLCERDGIRLVEQAFSVAEAKAAKEAFISSASTFVWPVIAIDGEPVGDGKPGEVALGLRELYVRTALAEFSE